MVKFIVFSLVIVSFYWITHWYGLKTERNLISSYERSLDTYTNLNECNDKLILHLKNIQDINKKQIVELITLVKLQREIIENIKLKLNEKGNKDED